MNKKQKRLRRYVRILRLIAETDKPLNKNQIWTILKPEKIGSEPTILYAIEDLRKWNMLELVKTETRVRGGKTFNYYILTKLGLSNLVTSSIEARLVGFLNNKTFRQLAEKYRKELAIFSLWPVFIDAGLEEVARRQLWQFLIIFHGKQLEALVYRPNYPESYGRHERFSSSFESEGLGCTPEEDLQEFMNPEWFTASEKWNVAIRSNAELQNLFISGLLNRAHGTMGDINKSLKHVVEGRVKLSRDNLKRYNDLMAEFTLLRDNASLNSK